MRRAGLSPPAGRLPSTLSALRQAHTKGSARKDRVGQARAGAKARAAQVSAPEHAAKRGLAGPTHSNSTAAVPSAARTVCAESPAAGDARAYFMRPAEPSPSSAGPPQPPHAAAAATVYMCGADPLPKVGQASLPEEVNTRALSFGFTKSRLFSI